MSDFFTLDNGEVIALDEYGAVSVAPTDRPLTVVALHGLGGGGYFFAGVARSMASRGAVLLCPDMPGSGLSRRGTRPISLDDFADVIVQLIERNTPGPVALIGHSMGTIIALKVYARIPDRITAMMFVGGLPAPLPEVQARLRNLAALARCEGMGAVARVVVPVVFAGRSLDAIPDKVAMFQRLLLQGDPESYAQTALALADASAVDVVPQVSAPCLCVTGAHDRYAPPTAVREFAGRISATACSELSDCGHMPFFEVPQAFDEAVQGFLEESI
jgi:pimeloyl-ACP methyl ester carboxylesterase